MPAISAISSLKDRRSRGTSREKPRSKSIIYLERTLMSTEGASKSGTNPILTVLLVLALIGVGVLGYLYYRQQQEVVKIDVPGFEGSITKGDGVDIEIGKDK
jgi:uncharacterized protein HemX